MLQGSEVKSLRDGRVSLGESYGRMKNGEVWLVGYANGYTPRGLSIGRIEHDRAGIEVALRKAPARRPVPVPG